ncbi:hypothetical protein [Brevibacillus choshinensis]|uniref:hypothetical protein n=1 Tax=Brevibacillus choshinensis TaxID=54911 RepID=UPI002E21B4A9|nr:hypothetical protein [Brevibacillus choshinensis]
MQMHHRNKFLDNAEDEIRKAGEISYAPFKSSRYCGGYSCLLLKQAVAAAIFGSTFILEGFIHLIGSENKRQLKEE